jgi:hypothetical protein
VVQGLTICQGWHSGKTLKPDVFKELKAFTHGPDFVARQIAKVGDVAASAWSAAKAYAAADPAHGTVSKALFCWFFDVYTQNGGLKGVGYGDVKAFLAAHGTAKADDIICDWLASLTEASASYRDCHDNAKLWRNNVPDAKLSLLVLSYLRAQLSRLEYRGNVMNRKGTIALGHGWVNREKHDLTALLA